MKRHTVTICLVLLAIAIAVFPMFLHFGGDSDEPFAGTDDAAQTAVEQESPDYKPWAEPLIGELPPEVESGLFSLQAALGAGVLGYVLGNYRGRARRDEELSSGTR